MHGWPMRGRRTSARQRRGRPMRAWPTRTWPTRARLARGTARGRAPERGRRKGPPRGPAAGGEGPSPRKARPPSWHRRKEGAGRPGRVLTAVSFARKPLGRPAGPGRPSSKFGSPPRPPAGLARARNARHPCVSLRRFIKIPPPPFKLSDIYRHTHWCGRVGGGGAGR